MICKILFILIALFQILTTNTYAKDMSKSSVILDMDTGRILYKNNENEQKLIASTTKIMTAILTIENSNITDIVEVGEEILSMYGTNIYLNVGEEITIETLLYGLMLRSGNDAAVVLAKYIGQTEEKFVMMMNNKAKELGMNNTKFANPHGLDDDTENYSTAYDMALLSIYANKNHIYRKISKTKKYSINSKNKMYLWYNRNKLLQQYKYCTGGKNGYTPRAGKTLVSTASKDSLNLTIVSLNDDNCYNNHRDLYIKYFNKYKNYQIVKKGSVYKNNNKTYVAAENFSYPMTRKEKENIYIEVNEKNQDKKTYAIIDGIEIECATLNDRGSNYVGVIYQDLNHKDLGYRLGDSLFEGECRKLTDNTLYVEDENGDIYEFVRINP